ncbi:hypothetical protein IV203_024143 [Nitzschia inconspicua]|uniref:Uncharacterized protein n=1 Tax=Nitzschia inconspicua TaxID=303405 RepID=A0A9K3PB82_9STRA|nr:hypothetical protein IV203_024143 [Nitzschia inconspicua]
MELPFAVESEDGSFVAGANSSLHQSESSSLVTASSQGSFMNSSLLPPNTPQDVVLPAQFQTRQQQDQQQIHRHGQLVVQSASPPPQDNNNPEADFTYVNVTETDADEDEVDILMMEGANISLSLDHEIFQQTRGDVLVALLSGMQPKESDAMMNQTESANEAAQKASEAKKQGDLVSALEYHSFSAKLYKGIAVTVRARSPSLANSLLLLSQSQARSAIALKSIVKLSPAELRQVLPPSDGEASRITNTASAALSQKERLRAAVRGALGSKHPHEADLSESQFLGDATISSPNKQSDQSEDSRNDQEGTLLTEGQESPHNSANPVDEMMELERELRDMDMALELGNSISSLDSRMQHRMKASMIDGSFMVVPPGSQSYMASSMWSPGTATHGSARQHPPASNVNQGVRARANRVQNMLDASTTQTYKPAQPPPNNHMLPANTHKISSGLESSWWGNSSTTSQILTSSLGTRTGMEAAPISELSGGQSSANTKQIMRLMDSLKTLGDENAALLREVEELEAARAESKAARESMKRFKSEYTKRFTSLKKALEKFRQEHPQGQTSNNNPVNSSDFMKSASVSDQLQRQEQLIRKLTADLKKEKEESKKKDAALRKYESFYREVKARSAQKAAQRQQLENQQQQRQVVRPRGNAPTRSTQR